MMGVLVEAAYHGNKLEGKDNLATMGAWSHGREERSRSCCGGGGKWKPNLPGRSPPLDFSSLSSRK